MGWPSTGSISYVPKTGGVCLTGVVCHVGSDLVPGTSGFSSPDSKVAVEWYPDRPECAKGHAGAF